MERKFTNENFERFLRQNADGLRMRPSDKVWKGISQNLNRRRRITVLLFAVCLFTATGLGYFITNQTGNTAHRTPVAHHPASPATTAIKTPLVQDKPSRLATALVSTEPGRKGNDLSGTATRNTGTTGSVSPEKQNLPAVQDAFQPEVVDSYFDDGQKDPGQSEVTATKETTDPLTIESVFNSFKGKRKSRIGTELYFTPTVSYRKLNNNVDNVVTHKPDFGFALGFAAKYPVTNKLKIRGGFQFNVNRYDIKTYNAPTEVATIRLNSRNRIESVNTPTNYNNISGYKSNWLENFYFQVSAPVGVELKLRGDEKMQFGIAGTVQPTYLLGDRAYLISTDYKNYAEVPRLIRHWNMNTSLETFVAYSTGHLQWQVGPQVRYQILSSFVKRYPVRENLFDFGLKVGISLNNQ
jgi:hypothetical protein